MSRNLSNWVKQAKIDHGKEPPGALTSEELAKLRQLRKEVKVLREERDILKKAAAFSPRKGMKFDFIEAEEGQTLGCRASAGCCVSAKRLLRFALSWPINTCLGRRTPGHTRGRCAPRRKRQLRQPESAG